MRVYQFTEQAYYPAWKDHAGSLRINLPNTKLDPKIAGELFNRYYDEWQVADEVGLDIMLNEHHQTATCLSSTVVVGLSIMARITKKARLLVLGYPLGHRCDAPRSSRRSTWFRAAASTWDSSKACPTNFRHRIKIRSASWTGCGKRTTSS